MRAQHHHDSDDAHHRDNSSSDGPQTEPVDLSLNKPRPSLAKPTSTILSSNPALRGGLTAISSTTTATAIPATVLSSGSILASAGGMMGGQQILHVIHTIPSVNVPSSMAMGVGQLQTIPVVVQSLPVVYTAVPTATAAAAGDTGNNGVSAAITVPLIGSDGRSEGSGERWRQGVCVCV